MLYIVYRSDYSYHENMFVLEHEKSGIDLEGLQKRWIEQQIGKQPTRELLRKYTRVEARELRNLQIEYSKKINALMIKDYIQWLTTVNGFTLQEFKEHSLFPIEGVD